MNKSFEKILQHYQAGFRQNSEATCGPASVILSAIGLGLELKQECDWSNERFAVFMPIDQFPKRGMGLHELQFITELIYGSQVDVIARRSYPENFAQFLQDVQKSSDSNSSVIVVNYLQDDFVKENIHPSGNPHHSVIVGWNTINHNLLIADVDPAVHKPYWVSIENMFESMGKPNTALNLPRGWLVIRKRN